MNLKNKTVWITGASSGIGEALAYEYAKQGANLVLSSRNESTLKKVKTKCSGGNQIWVVPLDLANHSSFQEIVKKVIDKASNIDILVNNAGVSQRALAKHTAFEVDKKLIDINLLGTIALTKAILPHMIENQTGQFIVITSIMGKFSAPLRSAYAAAKHGLHGFFDALRVELHEDNIKVLLVTPGFIRTNISLNALTGDGSKQNTMDKATAGGIRPEVLAKNIVKAAQKGKNEVAYGGAKELLALYLKRFCPSLLNRILRKARVT